MARSRDLFSRASRTNPQPVASTAESVASSTVEVAEDWDLSDSDRLLTYMYIRYVAGEGR